MNLRTILDHRVICHPAVAVSLALTPTVAGRYSIYPPVTDERLSRPEPTQINVFHLLLVSSPEFVVFVLK